MNAPRNEPGEAAPRTDDGPVLPEVTEDERALGWGEDRDDERRDAEWYRRQRPPHHD